MPEPSDTAPDQRLWHLWRRGQRPDVWDFLARAGELSPAQVVDVLAVDQQERWRCGERVPAEAYLRRCPALEADAEKAVELVYREFLTRAELGEGPALEEYLRRFPRYADRLRQQLDLRRALDSAPAAPGPGGPPAALPDVPGYEFVRELGRGAMGVVYLARQLSLHRLVAVKMLRPAPPRAAPWPTSRGPKRPSGNGPGSCATPSWSAPAPAG